MHNRLIFQYHRVRAQAESEVAKGLSLRGRTDPLGTGASDGGTQEGRSTQAMVVLG